MPSTGGTERLPVRWRAFQRAAPLARGLSQPDPSTRRVAPDTVCRQLTGLREGIPVFPDSSVPWKARPPIQVGWETGVVALRARQGGLRTKIRREPHLAAPGRRPQRGPLFNVFEQRKAILILGPQD